MLLASMSSTAQIRVGLGLTFGSPSGDFADVVDLGVGGYIEPKYAVNEKIDVGLHLAAMIFGGSGGGGTSFTATNIEPILATGDFKISNSKVTPYVGAGLGVYLVDFGSVEISGFPSVDGGSETKFGFAPRAGVMLGRLNLGLSYNIVSDVNYLAFGLGFEVGAKRN